MQTAKNPLRISQGSIELDDIVSDLQDSESTTSLNLTKPATRLEKTYGTSKTLFEPEASKAQKTTKQQPQTKVKSTPAAKA